MGRGGDVTQSQLMDVMENYKGIHRYNERNT